MGLIIDSVSFRADAKMHSLSQIIFDYLGRKYTVEKQLSRRYIQILISINAYTNTDSFCKLISLFLKSKTKVDSFCFKIYLQFLDEVKVQKIDVSKEQSKIELKVFIDSFHKVFANQGIFVKLFTKEIENDIFKENGQILIDFNKAMIKMLLFLDQYIKNLKNVFFRSSDLNSRGLLNLSEFSDALFHFETIFYNAHQSEIATIFNEFSMDELMNANGFQACIHKHGLFSEMTKTVLFERFACFGLVDDVTLLIENWSLIKRIFENLVEKMYTKKFKLLSNLIETQMLKGHEYNEELLWIVYKALEVEVDNIYLRKKIKSLFVVEEVEFYLNEMSTLS
jgi:hypothetical protein